MAPELTDSMEDYLEAVYLLQEGGAEVRVSGVAAFLGVSKPSVVAAVNHLEGKGLVTHEPYGDIKLTAPGEQRAQVIYGRHVSIRRFFTEVLGVARGMAEQDACRLEHLLAPETISRMQAFLEFVTAEEGRQAEWLTRCRKRLGTQEPR